MLWKGVRNRRAARHVVTVFLEDDLAAEAVRVFSERALHGGEHRLDLRFIACQRQPTRAVEACSHVPIAEQRVRVVARKAVSCFVDIVRRAGELYLIAVIFAQQIVEPAKVICDFERESNGCRPP